MTRNKSSWDRRYWNCVSPRDDETKPHSTESNIRGFSAMEILNGVRGLATLLRDIALCPDEDANEQDLLYMADRLEFLCLALEEKVRMKADTANAKSEQKPKQKSKARRGKKANRSKKGKKK